MTLGQLREGVFEARLLVGQGGEHTVRVKDPVTGELADVSFQVTSLSLERRSAARNVIMQTQLAQATGEGRLRSGNRRPAAGRDPRPIVFPETSIKVVSLWDTWLVFGLVVGLLVVEWLCRKMIHLHHEQTGLPPRLAWPSCVAVGRWCGRALRRQRSGARLAHSPW